MFWWTRYILMTKRRIKRRILINGNVHIQIQNEIIIKIHKCKSYLFIYEE